MISPGHLTRVWAYPEPADLRRGFCGLYGLVQSGLGRDPLSGETFLLVNRRRRACEVLFWDGTGLVIPMKRLENGRFAAPWERGHDVKGILLTGSELALFLEGCTLVGRQPLSPRIRPSVDVLMPRALCRSWRGHGKTTALES